YLNRRTVSPESAAIAWEALSNAEKLGAKASPLEKDLIHALSKRYAANEPEDRTSLNQAYADEMHSVWKRYPQNADVATLFAESAMDVHPWDYWKHGTPQ